MKNEELNKEDLRKSIEKRESKLDKEKKSLKSKKIRKNDIEKNYSKHPEKNDEYDEEYSQIGEYIKKSESIIEKLENEIAVRRNML